MLRAVFPALLAFGLLGCDSIAGAWPSGPARADATSAGIRTLSLMDGAVRVRGPDGYCVDQSASDARRGFAVLAGCGVLSSSPVNMPALDALITVQFGQAGTAAVNGNEEVFARFLKTGSGRALLAGNGDLASITDIATATDRAAVMVRFTDASGPAFVGTNGPQWRGFIDVRGRLATVTIRSFNRAALSRGEGERLLVLALAELSEVNAAQ